MDADLEGLERCAKNLVRLALAMERRRQPLKREDLLRKEKYLLLQVLQPAGFGGQQHTIQRVMEMAQSMFRSTFAMELCALKPRERHRAPSSTSTSKPAQSWVLISTLDGSDRDAVLELPSALETQKRGLLALILSFIFLHQDSLTDEVICRFLVRLGFDVGQASESPVHPSMGSWIELANNWAKQGYLEKLKIKFTDRETTEWRWGPRSKAEFESDSIVAFIIKHYGDAEHQGNLERSILQCSTSDGVSR